MSRSNKKQFTLNAASGWLAQGSLVITGMLLLRYAIFRLGVKEYGLFQLGRSGLDILVFLKLGMAPSLVRFCSQAIAAKDKDEIARISSAAQLLLGGMGAIGMIIGLSLIPFFINFYEVPSSLVFETKGLLICMAISLFVNFLFLVPNGIVMGANRYDAINYFNILCNFLRLGLVIASFELIRPSLLLFGVAILMVQVFRLLGVFFLALKYIGTEVIFSFDKVSKHSFRKMIGFGSLNFINTIAASFLFQGPVLIIGKFLGESAVTAFAPALLISQALQGFLGRISIPLAPLASRELHINGGERLGKLATTVGQIAGILGFGFVIPFAFSGSRSLACG